MMDTRHQQFLFEIDDLRARQSAVFAEIREYLGNELSSRIRTASRGVLVAPEGEYLVKFPSRFDLARKYSTQSVFGVHLDGSITIKAMRKFNTAWGAFTECVNLPLPEAVEWIRALTAHRPKAEP